MRDTYTRFFVRIATVLFAFAVLGCDDVTPEDKKREKLGEDLAKYKAVEGTYEGTLISNETQQPIGNFSIQLKATTRLTYPTQGGIPEERPAIRGKSVFDAGNRLDMNFNDVYFDPETNKILASVVAVSDSTQTELRDFEKPSLDLNASFENNTLIGTLEAFGNPELGASFRLSRNAENQLRKRSTPPQLIAPKRLRYNLHKKEASADLLDGLVLIDEDQSSEVGFFNLFMPLRIMSAYLIKREEYGFYIYFNPVKYDSRADRFFGKHRYNIGSDNASWGEYQISCIKNQVADAPGGHELECSIMNTRAGKSNYIFRLAESK